MVRRKPDQPKARSYPVVAEYIPVNREDGSIVYVDKLEYEAHLAERRRKRKGRIIGSLILAALVLGAGVGNALDNAAENSAQSGVEIVRGDTSGEVAIPFDELMNSEQDTAAPEATNAHPEAEQDSTAKSDKDTTREEVEAGSARFVVVTFNVRGAHHTDGPNKGGLDTGRNRMKNGAFDELMSQSPSVVGFQELEPEQRDEFLKQSKAANLNWDIHPSKPIYGHGAQFRSSNSIAWDADVFERVNEGFNFGLKYLGESRLAPPYVILRHKETGVIIVVYNTHDPANVGSLEHRDRESNARAHRAFTGEMMQREHIDAVFVIGDFNSTEKADPERNPGVDRETELPYCILTNGTSDASLANAFDSEKNAKRADLVDCPTRDDSRFRIDHIYHSYPGVVTHSWRSDNDMMTKKLSDHPLVVADVTVSAREERQAGSDDTVSNGELDLTPFLPYTSNPHETTQAFYVEAA